MKGNIPSIDVAATARNIKSIMQRRGIAVKDIQQYFGFASPQCIYHWLDGRNLPTMDHLYALSDFFGMPMDMIVKGDRKYDYQIKDYAMYGRIITYYEYASRMMA